MCNFSEAVYERGRTKGKEEGIAIGKEEGKFERNIVSLKLLMNRFKLSFVEAMETLNINECDYDMYREILKI